VPDAKTLKYRFIRLSSIDHRTCYASDGQQIGNYHLTTGNHEIPVAINGIVLVTWVSDEGLISKKLFFN